jgi:hypothetical protein
MMPRISGFHFHGIDRAGIVRAASRVDSGPIAAYWKEGRSTMPGRISA